MKQMNNSVPIEVLTQALLSRHNLPLTPVTPPTRKKKLKTMSPLLWSSSLTKKKIGKALKQLRTGPPLKPVKEVNVLEFLTQVCPDDIVPKILAFAGPQKMQVLGQVNKACRDVVNAEYTWRVMCEDLHKVSYRLDKAVDVATAVLAESDGR
jgi:hypothetical protein